MDKPSIRAPTLFIFQIHIRCLTTSICRRCLSQGSSTIVSFTPIRRLVFLYFLDLHPRSYSETQSSLASIQCHSSNNKRLIRCLGNLGIPLVVEPELLLPLISKPKPFWMERRMRELRLQVHNDVLERLHIRIPTTVLNNLVLMKYRFDYRAMKDG
ncbi:uncharacterized protein DS421_2g53740 [Arachis hypogaea]|nr:uncharacterized protein DS421_2g53740 [Arachis hypogaea]